MKINYHQVKLLIVFGLFFIYNLTTAQISYTAKGKVLDAQTNEPLPGATVQLQGNGKGTVTNLDGQFILDKISQKKATLLISYISYQPAAIECDFSNQRTLIYTIKLNPSTTKLEQVEVRGQARGQVKAMIEQKKAINIKNVVSSEQIEKFPDVNAAEAMQRIPGITIQREQGEGKYIQLRGTPPELTNFNINGEQIPSPEGEVRYVGMDIISADQIETIEVTKVLTPDMDADGIGGNVNIVTKKATDQEPEINASLAAGYGNLRQSDNYQLQFSYGQRYGNFGFKANGSYYINNQGADNMEFEFAKGPFWGSTDEGIDNYHVQYREVQLRHYETTRKRTGLSATLDYQIGNHSTIYLRGMFNRFIDDEVRRRLIYPLDDALSMQTYLYGDVERDVKDREKIQEVNSINLGGEHKFSLLSLDYEGAYSAATENQPDRMEAIFDSPGHGINIKFNLDDPDWPVANFIDTIGRNHALNYEEYKLDELTFENSVIEDNNLTFKLNVKIPYSFGFSHQGFFKIGGKTRLKEKTRDVKVREYGAYYVNSYSYPDKTPPMNLLTVDDGFHVTDFLDRGYELDHMVSPSLLRDFYEKYPHHFVYDRHSTATNTSGEDYTANEEIYAFYGMVKHDWNDLMFSGGVRYEKTLIDYQGIRVIKNHANKFEGLDTLTDKRTHEFILPMFQFKYTISNDFNVRLGYTYSYSRPNFEDVLPYRDDKGRDEVKYGNPDLEYPKSMNVDLLIERYLRDGGILSGGVFYKNIDDFVFYYNRFAHEGEDPSAFGLMHIEKAENGNEAFVYGAELQSQFKLFFLPGFLGDFGLFMNYTYTHSRALINKRFPANDFNAIIRFGEETSFGSETEEEELTLPGQARHTSNLAFFYDSKKIYAKISANYHDAFLDVLGADSDLDIYYDEAWHFDFTANYSISENLKIFTDFRNLSNAPLKYYMGKPDRVAQQEFYSWTGRLGLKLNF